MRSLSLQLNCESELLSDRCCLHHLGCVIRFAGSCHPAVASTSILWLMKMVPKPTTRWVTLHLLSHTCSQGFAVQCQAPRKAELDFASWQVAFDSWCLAVSVCSSMVGAAAKFSELVDYKHRVRLMRAPLHIALHLLLPPCVSARS